MCLLQNLITKLLDIKYLKECVNLELITLNSPCQTHDDFENFMKNFELNLDEMNKKNPFLTVALGDFNAKSQTWFDKTLYKGSKLYILTCSHGLHQLINESAHLLDSCVT